MTKTRYSFFICLIIFISTLQFSIPPKDLLFQEISSDYSGLHFSNNIEIKKIVYGSGADYVYGHNAAGVGVGDFNNDGLPDLFFSSNMVANKLYLNKGKFTFTDVTDSAGVAGNKKWGTGVSVVDINGDGLLDIYVSHSGNLKDIADLKNELFINTGIINGIPHFQERAKEYGLDLPGTHTTQVAFFDYDHDGDLDAFILNHGLEPYQVFQPAEIYHQTFNPLNSNMLMRNDNGHFVDVTKESGIIGSDINFGLGIVINDLNNDGWPDIYCTSDFTERDFCYINQKNGKFLETAQKSFTHLSSSSMGTDASDYNNDGNSDIITLDMKPNDYFRQKVTYMADNDDAFNRAANLGYYIQFSRNMLQQNFGNDKDGIPHFSEIGQLQGIAATDWSWGPLFADFDNDGWKDLFISSGYPDDMSMDRRNNYIQDKTTVSLFTSNSHLYKNNNGKGFSDVTNSWKPEKKALSYGAVYADFDNDGKLDLLISNLNSEPILLRNKQTDKTAGNYLSISLQQEGLNYFALGAKVNVTAGKLNQFQELEPVRGYQSSQDYTLHFGMGSEAKADIVVTWPDGSTTKEAAVPTNQHIKISKKNTGKGLTNSTSQQFSFSELPIQEKDSFISKQFDHPDFKYQFSLPYKVSDYGQVVASGDINGDGILDYYIGGEAGASKFFMIGKPDGNFTKTDPGCFDVTDDNTTAIFLDADKDGDQDLILQSRKGRSTQPQLYYSDTVFITRFFENTGKGNFKELTGVFPSMNICKTIAAGDFDQDGDPDLFMGGYTRQITFGKKTDSYILRNDSKPGKILFSDVTAQVLPDKNIGMITSAEWKDMNNDKYPELLVTGEWMSCKYFSNINGKLVDQTFQNGLGNLTGLWNCIYPVDINGDGYIDIVAGNVGQNNQFNVSEKFPAKLTMIDFESAGGGIPNPVPLMSTYYSDSLEYPIVFRDELLSISQRLRTIFNNYESYAKLTMPQLVKKTGAKINAVYSCNNLRSGVFINDGKNHFKFIPFPESAQISRVNSVVQFNNGTKYSDLLLAGNYFGYKIQFGRQDALPVLQLQYKEGQLEGLMPGITGLFSTGQVSKMFVYLFKNKQRILLFKKNEAPQMFEYHAN